MPFADGIKNMVDRQLELGRNEEELNKKELAILFSERARLNLKIYGKVKGVFFRHFVKKSADALSLSGWVKNSADCVDVIAEGEKQKLRELIIECKKGSPLSKVEKIDYKWSEFTGKFSEFFVN